MEDSIIVQISKYLAKAYDKKTFGVCWEEPRELYLLKPIELNGMKFEPGLLQKHSHKKTLAFLSKRTNCLMRLISQQIWTIATATRLDSALSLDTWTLQSNFSMRGYSRWEPQS